MAENENKLQDMIRTSLESIRAMVDANTVVGTPIETAAGTTIIPISKISVGYASGGADTKKDPGARSLFAGGGGTGLSIQPVCFIAVNATGEVEVLPLGGNGAAPDAIEKLTVAIEKAPDILARIKAVFPDLGKKKKKDNDADVVEEVMDEAAEAVADVIGEDDEG
ncbi:MAG: sporulation protein YtfJ [Clostridia bacterium]|nr:sporulation protein YtfJ [Clostridia bacterium]